MKKKKVHTFDSFLRELGCVEKQEQLPKNYMPERPEWILPWETAAEAFARLDENQEDRDFLFAGPGAVSSFGARS